MTEKKSNLTPLVSCVAGGGVNGNPGLSKNSHQNTQNSPNTPSPDTSHIQAPNTRLIVLPLLVLFITECLFFLSRLTGIAVSGPVIPMEWGLAKDVLDIFVVAIFPWHGWVFAAPLVVAMVLGTRFRWLLLLLLLSSLATSLVGTYFEFREVTGQKVLIGIATYATINAGMLVSLTLAAYTFREIRKCIR